MIECSIAGFGHLRLEHLVLDHNGTLTLDGHLLPGVAELLVRLAEDLKIHVLTADTFGLAKAQLAGLPLRLTIMPPERQDESRRAVVRALGGERCVCIGNGRNDRLMMAEAALGIAVIQGEGASPATVAAAEVVCTDILTALGLLTHPLRLVATLYS